MNVTNLTPRQTEVVEATDRRILVKGGAGTGKTTVALWAARAALERQGNEGKRVLFLTFSRTAVDQIAERSRFVVASVEDRIEVSTFHSFAYRLVRRFGHHAGVTDRHPEVQSASQAKLLGKDEKRLVYDDLAPLALRILDNPKVAALLEQRWCMVICDEFQDTGDHQWSLLESLSRRARLLLLGDENQLIYSFLERAGVSPERMRTARKWADLVIELEPASHRDPSGAIPALANAVRQRRFNDPAVDEAIANGRLHIRTGVDLESAVEAIEEALNAAWARGCRTFGVFAHSNQSVAELSYRMNEAGIRHYLVGIPDAEADALTAMLTLVQYAYSEVEWADVRVALGTYLTACSRGSAPPLARSLARGGSLPGALQERLDDIQAATETVSATSLIEVANMAVSAWESLGILASGAPWSRAGPTFTALARQAAQGSESLSRTAKLANAVAQVRLGAMFESQRRRLPAVQLMNLHQTKGREADAVIILSDDDDYHGNEREPFVDGSRLLYVILTRARREVTVLLGHEPHALVAPLASFE